MSTPPNRDNKAKNGKQNNVKVEALYEYKIQNTLH